MMLIEKLKNFSYYYKKLPLYMRNSYGIKEHFKIIWSVMIQLETIQENVLDAMNILQSNYLQDIVAKYDNVNGYDFKVLDYIAALYGVNRDLSVSYIRHSDKAQVNMQLHLTNAELYMLIKSRIIQNNYDGSYEQVREYYKQIDLPVYVCTSNNAECYLYLDKGIVSGNIYQLFMANLLTIKSMGIIYITQEIDISKIGIWASMSAMISSNNAWDVALWS